MMPPRLEHVGFGSHSRFVRGPNGEDRIVVGTLLSKVPGRRTAVYLIDFDTVDRELEVAARVESDVR